MVKHGLKILALGIAMSQPAAALATTTTAHSAKSAADRYYAWRSEAVRALSARSDANSVATAAALSFTNSFASPPRMPQLHGCTCSCARILLLAKAARPR